MINVLCVKHGTKYDYRYVNHLYNAVTRHLTREHRFFCFTDDSSNISDEIKIIDLPTHSGMHGWWCKPYIFSSDHFSEGDINLYFDLDMVIVKSIDHFIHYEPDKFVGLQDFSRVFRRNYTKLGSAVMKWPAKSQTHIWTDFEKDVKSITKKFRGDQDWIWNSSRDDIHFFPEKWIQSYKWQIRDRSELVKTKQGQQFSKVKNPHIPTDTSVLAFHGTPDVHDVNDPVIVKNWC